jgi:hypothetical protein
MESAVMILTVHVTTMHTLAKPVWCSLFARVHLERESTDARVSGHPTDAHELHHAHYVQYHTHHHTLIHAELAVRIF